MGLLCQYQKVAGLTEVKCHGDPPPHSTYKWLGYVESRPCVSPFINPEKCIVEA